jgi:hypothetical protein
MTHIEAHLLLIDEWHAAFRTPHAREHIAAMYEADYERQYFHAGTKDKTTKASSAENAFSFPRGGAPEPGGAQAMTTPMRSS